MANRHYVSDEYVICPHCGANYGDCSEWVSDQVCEMNCDHCDKPFRFWAEYSVAYLSVAIDGSENNFS